MWCKNVQPIGQTWRPHSNFNNQKNASANFNVTALKFFYYQIPTNQVIGWHFVPATFTANNEDTANLDGGFKVPITPTTTTSNGTSVAALLGAGYNSTNTMVYFENSSTNNADSDAMTDVQEWIIGGNITNVVGGLEAEISSTNGNPKISWEPNTSNRVYNVSRSTNLVDGVGFENIGTVTNDVGYAVDTNGWDNASYRVEVALP